MTSGIDEYTSADIRSLYSFVCYGARNAGLNAVAISYFGRDITYGEFLESVEDAASGLYAHGVRKGDSVTIYLPNIPQCVIAVYAVNRLGAVCNLVHPLSTRKELEYCVSLTKSRIIFAYEGNEKNTIGLGAEIIRCRLPEYFPQSLKGAVMEAVFNHSVKKMSKAPHITEWSALCELGTACRTDLPVHDVSSDDIAAVMYTGGTTGDSKGVMLTNAAINSSSATSLDVLLPGRDCIGLSVLGILPVFHAFGFAIIIHQTLCFGMRIVLLPSFDEKKCANLILKEKLEVVIGVPTMFERLYPYLSKYALSFIRVIGSGGDRVSHDLAERYNALLTQTKFRTGYGMTESCGCCALESGDYLDHPDGCIGPAIGSNKCCLVNPGTDEVIDNSLEGELCIQTPAMMAGYYDNPEATAAVLRRHADGEIWLHTGDIATIDHDGRILFRSRYKRMMKVNGFNVYPTQIETTMEACPVIRDVCAVPMPWKTDVRVKLYVTLNNPAMNHEMAVEEISCYARTHLNRWSSPKEIRIISEMPKTKLNKTDYQKLSEEK